jgi:hypothetical protein
MLQAL